MYLSCPMKGENQPRICQIVNGVRLTFARCFVQFPQAVRFVVGYIYGGVVQSEINLEEVAIEASGTAAKWICAKMIR